MHRQHSRHGTDSQPVLSSAKPKPAAAAAPSESAPGSPPIRSGAKASMPDEFPSEAAPPKKGPPASVLARLGVSTIQM